MIRNVQAAQNPFSKGLPLTIFKKPKRYSPEVYESRRRMSESLLVLVLTSAWSVSAMSISRQLLLLSAN